MKRNDLFRDDPKVVSLGWVRTWEVHPCPDIRGSLKCMVPGTFGGWGWRGPVRSERSNLKILSLGWGWTYDTYPFRDTTGPLVGLLSDTLRKMWVTSLGPYGVTKLEGRGTVSKHKSVLYRSVTCTLRGSELTKVSSFCTSNRHGLTLSTEEIVLTHPTLRPKYSTVPSSRMKWNVPTRFFPHQTDGRHRRRTPSGHRTLWILSCISVPGSLVFPEEVPGSHLDHSPVERKGEVASRDNTYTILCFFTLSIHSRI